MRLVCVLLVILTSIAGYAQSNEERTDKSSGQEIRGIVMNLLGQPLKGTVISISGREKNLLSGETGEFTFEIDDAEGSFGFVSLRHPEYAELRIPLQEFRGTMGRLSVMLDARVRNCRHVIQ